MTTTVDRTGIQERSDIVVWLLGMMSAIPDEDSDDTTTQGLMDMLGVSGVVFKTILETMVEQILNGRHVHASDRVEAVMLLMGPDGPETTDVVSHVIKTFPGGGSS